MNHPRDARTVLGLPPSATPAQVRRAFRQLVLQLHPDRHQGDPQQAARLRAVVEAYEELTGKRPRMRARRTTSARSPWARSTARQDAPPPP
ncbi:MAG: J domain-containing protein, partial [Myxococcota bacterium]|nr:J domain-containing protein [Myxococcota bacterium]